MLCELRGKKRKEGKHRWIHHLDSNLDSGVASGGEAVGGASGGDGDGDGERRRRKIKFTTRGISQTRGSPYGSFGVLCLRG